jgi:hypothetical protein
MAAAWFFVDSSLEEHGFELTVPLRWCGGSRPLRPTSFRRTFPRKRPTYFVRGTDVSNPAAEIRANSLGRWRGAPGACLAHTQAAKSRDGRRSGSAWVVENERGHPMQLDASIAAIVTGGASGLGAATTAPGQSWVKVALFDVNGELGDRVAGEIGGWLPG